MTAEERLTELTRAFVACLTYGYQGEGDYDKLHPALQPKARADVAEFLGVLGFGNAIPEKGAVGTAIEALYLSHVLSHNSAGCCEALRALGVEPRP